VVPVTIRGLVDLLDESKNLQEVLNAARDMRDNMNGNRSPQGNAVQTYSTIVESLCDIRLTGPSRQIATALSGATQFALINGNRELCALAMWYSSCCRMAYLFPAGHNGHAFDKREASRLSAGLHQLITKAQRQQTPNLAGVAATTILEYAMRVPLGAETLRDLSAQANRLMQSADHTNARVSARTEFLTEVERLNGALPPSVDHAALLYLPGELAATIR